MMERHADDLSWNHDDNIDAHFSYRTYLFIVYNASKIAAAPIEVLNT